MSTPRPDHTSSTAIKPADVYHKIFAAEHVLDDPYPLLRRLIEAGPVHQVGSGQWIAVSYDACVEVLRDPRFHIDAEAAGRARGGANWRDHPSLRLLNATLLVANPPGHSRMRRAVAAAFGPERVRAMGALIAQATDRLLDELQTDQPADMISGFADRLPVAVISPILGIEQWPSGDFRTQTMRFNLILERELTEANLADADASAIEIIQCIHALVAERRLSRHEDLISHLMDASAAGVLDEEEVAPLVFQIFNASYQTTASLLGNALLSLLREPGRLGELRGDAGRVARTVQEVLRTDPPVQSTGRHASRRLEFFGQRIEKGDLVISVLAAGNRDPRRFSHPDIFDINRASPPVLSFGWGIHHCLGARLAALEAEIALERMADRFPRMRPAGPPRRWPTANMRAFASFPVSLDAETRRDQGPRQTTL
ncbi:MAG TPA: cytochrome P450 [Trebonia sp.]